MTSTTQIILQHYQVRKTKKQKTSFIEYINSLANNLGHSCKVEKNVFFGTRNIVVGDVEKAKVVYAAHYDTCAVLPFPNFITPKSIGIYLIYQFAVCILFMLVPMFLITVLGGALGTMISGDVELSTLASLLVGYAYIIIFVLMMIVGPANKHTANDNTSGVTTLVDLMMSMPVEKRNEVAFVFFDLEEAGLLGSMAFRIKHRKAMRKKLIINFDCVSDGNTILFAVSRKAKNYVKALENAFPENENYNVEIKTRGVFYPSDNMNFSFGVGVAALKKTKYLNILYMSRIHTKRDVIYYEDNIKFLVEGSISLLNYI